MNAAAIAPPRVGIDALLAQLEHVQQTRSGWRADCPNDHRTHGTLSIAQADSGAILVHCFAGCAVAAVLATLGLSLGDIQPARLRDESPEARRAARAQFRLASASAAAGFVAREASIVLTAAADLLRGDALGPEDYGRLIEAVERIHAAQEALQ